MKKILILLLFGLTASRALAENRSLPQLDVAFSISTLGLGVQAARPLTSRSDIRGGFNFYNYDSVLSSDGASYSSRLTLNSVNAQYDQYLLGPLHVSGGALVWSGNKADGTVQVPAGHAFTLGGTTYISNPPSPVNGTAKTTVRHAAPLVLIGLGNFPRKGRIAYSLEAGVAFQSSPHTVLAMTGEACNSSGATSATGHCANIATTPAIQANVVAQQNKINEDLKPFKYYPVLQFSIGYKFK